MAVQQRQQATESERAASLAAGLRRGRHPSPLSAGRLAVMRVRAYWGLLLAVEIGMLAAVVLICTVPLYTNLVANVQLQAAINRQGPAGRNVEILAAMNGFSPSVRRLEDVVVRPLATTYLSTIAQASPANYLTAQFMPLVGLRQHGQLAAASARSEVGFQAFDYAQAGPHMQLLQGTFPQVASTDAHGQVQALVTAQMAQVLGVGPGDVLIVSQFGSLNGAISAVVVGVWQPIHADDPFWNGRIFTTNPVKDSDPYLFPVLLDSNSFAVAMTAFRGINVTQHWVYYVDPARITTRNVPAVASALGVLRTQVGYVLTNVGASASVLSGLFDALHDFTQQSSLLSFPLYMVLAQVVGLILIFIGVMAGLLVEAQAGDIATLKSRGAGMAQVLGGFVAQSALLGVLAALAGPWLAVVLSAVLIRWFVPSANVLGSGAGFGVSAVGASDVSQVVPAAVAAALLGVGAMAVAAVGAARADVLSFRRGQARITRNPFWQRTYLDVGLGLLCAVAYIDLNTFGGLGLREQLGPRGTTPLQLAAPALLLLAGALLLLRVFPVLAHAALGLAMRLRGVAGILALSQVARASSTAMCLALLLSLSVGLGLFALTVDASLVGNAAERAMYQTGADIRLTEHSTEQTASNTAIQARLAALPGVRGVGAVYRGPASLLLQGQDVSVQFMAVDPVTWGEVAARTSWRPQYASNSLARLMDLLRVHQQPPGVVNALGETDVGDLQHPVWALVSQSIADQFHLSLNDQFALGIKDAAALPTTLKVGAIVQMWPTLYPGAGGGFVVVGLQDYTTIAAVGRGGPNEYWVSASLDPAQRSALVKALVPAAPALDVNTIVDRLDVQQTISNNPVQAGMRGLFLTGALVALILAILGILVQSGMAARQRATQFAILRTLGVGGRQLVRILLGEQAIIFLFGTLAGTALASLLLSSTLAYLQFADTTVDLAQIGIPPYSVRVDITSIGVFYALLLGACGMALALVAWYAMRAGLGRTLRLGED